MYEDGCGEHHDSWSNLDEDGVVVVARKVPHVDTGALETLSIGDAVDVMKCPKSFQCAWWREVRCFECCSKRALAELRHSGANKRTGHFSSSEIYKQ